MLVSVNFRFFWARNNSHTLYRNEHTTGLFLYYIGRERNIIISSVNSSLRKINLNINQRQCMHSVLNKWKLKGKREFK